MQLKSQKNHNIERIMNTSIELHDTAVLSLHEVRGTMYLVFDCILHQSEGEPGVAEGDVYGQVQVWVLADASSLQYIESLPDSIYDGALTFGTPPVRCENMFSMQDSFAGPIVLNLELCDSGKKIGLTGSRLTIFEVGERRLIEKFRPKM